MVDFVLGFRWWWAFVGDGYSMLNAKDISLIEPYDEIPPRHCRFSIVTRDQCIEVPVSQLSGAHVALLTLLLAAIATPLCLVVYNALARRDNGIGVALLVSVAWGLGVFGPAVFWLCWPVGVLRPDHWIRFDRESGLLSIKGGFSEFRRDEMVALLSVTDLRKGKRQTEFQIVTGCSGAFSKHFVANCSELDPQLAFGPVIREIARFSGINYYFAVIDPEGDISIDGGDNAAEQSELPQSPIGQGYES